MSVLLETTLGDLVVDLDVAGSPELCRNFLKLAAARLYTQSLVFEVDRDQGVAYFGCPAGTGHGGASVFGYLDALVRRQIPVEESAERFLKRSAGRALSAVELQTKGRLVGLCMNGVADTYGSQVALTLTEREDRTLGDDDNASAPPVLSLGEVAEDPDSVLDKLADTYTDAHQRPYIDIRIRRCHVVYDPFDDPWGMAELLKLQGVVFDDDDGPRRVIASPSPERPPTEMVPLRLSTDEVIDDVDDERAAARRRQQEEALLRREDQSRTVMLELLGDLPPAELLSRQQQSDSAVAPSSSAAATISVAPPETVLFVCKLNPVTSAEDLELIFSRFDPQVRADLILDEQTRQSLQYAFLHFTTKQQATEAYFKMNQALVDDRRIVVDFCQSVSHVWDKYRQRLRNLPLGSGVRNTAKRSDNYRGDQNNQNNRHLGKREKKSDRSRYEPAQHPRTHNHDSNHVEHDSRHGSGREDLWYWREHDRRNERHYESNTVSRYGDKCYQDECDRKSQKPEERHASRHRTYSGDDSNSQSSDRGHRRRHHSDRNEIGHDTHQSRHHHHHHHHRPGNDYLSSDDSRRRHKHRRKKDKKRKHHNKRRHSGSESDSDSAGHERRSHKRHRKDK